MLKETPEGMQDMPIVFLAPKDLAGQKGVQRTNELHEVVAVLTAEGEDVSRLGCSYKGAE
jgi:hypothetical protein